MHSVTQEDDQYYAVGLKAYERLIYMLFAGPGRSVYSE